MIMMNENYRRLQSSYLFSTIAKKVAEFQAHNPKVDIIRLGIGDVVHALSPEIITAFHKGIDDQAQNSSFRGYGPEQGYEFLRRIIAHTDFPGCSVTPEEIFISDGAKCDTGNFQELFAHSARVAVPDPVYPVYVDSNVMAGRSGNWQGGRYEKFFYLEGNEENDFIPLPPDHDRAPDDHAPDDHGRSYDLIYLCFPNNPTGETATKETLQKWVDYARRNRSLILYDAAYVGFIRDASLPRSILEIPGAREVSVEFRSLSKTAGFTGTRCAYTVIPEECMVYDQDEHAHSVKDLWLRRQSTKFNGVSYPVQRAAEAVFTPRGQADTQSQCNYYLENARLVREQMLSSGRKVWGGENSPYIWVQAGGSSWALFDRLLNDAMVLITPGAGFGTCGEGYIRISAFNHRGKVEEALERISGVL
ncbi:MAG: LL-diaminopimelate aminotransferase [Salinispira sp.]